MICYLKFIVIFNMIEDDFILKLKAGYRQKDPRIRLQQFEYCLNTYKTQTHVDSLAFYIQQLTEQIELLRRQIPIEGYDSQIAQSGQEAIYKEIPRKNIIFAPLSTTLHYCLLYHPTADKNKHSSPFTIRKIFNVSDKRYTWLALIARAKVKDWEFLKQLVDSKASLGLKGISNKKKTPIGFEPFLQIISQNGGGETILSFFCSMIDDNEEKFQLAVTYKIYSLAIQTLVDMRDQRRLTDFRNWLVEELGAEKSIIHREKIDEALANKKIAWKKN